MPAESFHDDRGNELVDEPPEGLAEPDTSGQFSDVVHHPSSQCFALYILYPIKTAVHTGFPPSPDTFRPCVPASDI